MPRRTHTPAALRQIAWCQKFLILCMVGQLLVWVGYIALFALLVDGPRRNRDVEPMYLILGVSTLISLVAAVLIVLICAKSDSLVLGIFLGVLALIPCVSLIIIVVANSQATSVLKRRGVRVGFLGARLSDIDDLSDDDEDDDEYEERPPRGRGPRRGYAAIDEDEGW